MYRAEGALCGMRGSYKDSSRILLSIESEKFPNAADARWAIPLHQGAHGGR